MIFPAGVCAHTNVITQITVTGVLNDLWSIGKKPFSRLVDFGR